jgi:hypothetical protein
MACNTAEQNRWGGAVPLERPRPIEGACATRVRRRTGDLPGLRCAGVSHQALGGGIRRSSDQTSRWRSVRQRRCHRRGTPLGWGAGGSRLWSCARVDRAHPGCDTPPGRRSGRAAPTRRMVVWPVTLRHLGRGHGRSPDHRPRGGCSALVGGGRPTTCGKTASSMELRPDQPAAPAAARK